MAGPRAHLFDTMGVSLSTARWLAPASFLIDFAAQQYGMFSSPNMKDIHDRNLSFFSPQPYFIAGFFFPQQLFQIGWLYRLWKLDEKKPEERRELEAIVDFVPYYSLGNLCIAGKYACTVQGPSNVSKHGCSRGITRDWTSVISLSSSTVAPSYTISPHAFHR